MFQALGVAASQDRSLIKKKIKDLKVMMEKAKRNQEKAEKQCEKRRKKALEQQKDARKESTMEWKKPEFYLLLYCSTTPSSGTEHQQAPHEQTLRDAWHVVLSGGAPHPTVSRWGISSLSKSNQNDQLDDWMLPFICLIPQPSCVLSLRRIYVLFILLFIAVNWIYLFISRVNVWKVHLILLLYHL